MKGRFRMSGFAADVAAAEAAVATRRFEGKCERSFD